MKKLILNALILTATLGVFNFLASPVLAGSAYEGGGCVPVYGGGVECPRPGVMLVDKKVRNPKTDIFVDNLPPSDPAKYRPQEIVVFQITVKNSGDQNLGKVSLKDTIPQYVDYMSVSGGAENATFDQKSKVLSFEVNNLAQGAVRNIEVKARAAHPAVLPADKNVVCPVNVVTAETSGQNPDRDEAQFCIEKKMEVTAVPSAGPENWIISLAGLATALFTGVILRKKAYTS